MGGERCLSGHTSSNVYTSIEPFDQSHVARRTVGWRRYGGSRYEERFQLVHRRPLEPN